MEVPLRNGTLQLVLCKFVKCNKMVPSLQSGLQDHHRFVCRPAATSPANQPECWKRAGQDDRAGAARQALLEYRPVRLLTGPGGSQGPGGGAPGPPLEERLRLRPDDCHEPLPTQLLQKCGAPGNCCASHSACSRRSMRLPSVRASPAAVCLLSDDLPMGFRIGR